MGINRSALENDDDAAMEVWAIANPAFMTMLLTMSRTTLVLLGYQNDGE